MLDIGPSWLQVQNWLLHAPSRPPVAQSVQAQPPPLSQGGVAVLFLHQPSCTTVAFAQCAKHSLWKLLPPEQHTGCSTAAQMQSRPSNSSWGGDCSGQLSFAPTGKNDMWPAQMASQGLP